MDAEPMGKPGWPELAFCTMSTARKRSVLMHSSSNAGGATVAAMLLADGGLTVAAGMFALLRGGHNRSS
jgi:hypothetical protein